MPFVFKLGFNVRDSYFSTIFFGRNGLTQAVSSETLCHYCCVLSTVDGFTLVPDVAANQIKALGGLKLSGCTTAHNLFTQKM